MKPNFALNLTHEAIILLHRTARGWLAIGEAALDSADLSEALGYLRASALGLSPQGVTTKLILPNSQILYTEVEAPGPDAAARRRQVAAGLEGLTPYAVEDLVFDIWGKGPRVQVAVVARETLDEAEGFIEQHRFNPVSFVAIPPAGTFGGEPFFGQTKAASRLLAAGETVARDQDPVTVITRDSGRDDASPRPAREIAARPPEAIAETVPADGGADKDKAAAPPAGTDVAASVIAADLPPPLAQATPQAGPVPPVVADAPPPPTAAAQDRPLPAPGPAPKVGAAVPPTMAAPPVAPLAAPPPATVATATTPVTQPVLPPQVAVSPAPPPEAAAMAKPPRVPAPVPETAPPVAASPALPIPPSVPVEPQVVPSFSSRRREETARAALLPPAVSAGTPAATPPSPPMATPPSPPPATPPSPPPASPPSLPPVLPPASRPAAGADLSAPTPARTAAQFTAAPPKVTVTPAVPAPVAAPATAPAANLAPRLPVTEAPARAATPPAAAWPLGAAPPMAADLPPKPSSAGAASRLRPVAQKPPVPPLPGKRAAKQQSAPAGDASLRPGAASLAKGAVRTRGKPRYLGLALTGALLIFLMLVAAYSSLYLSQDDTGASSGTEVAGTPGTGDAAQPEAPAPVIVSAGDPVAPDPEMLADLSEDEIAALAEATPDPIPPDALAVDPAAELPAADAPAAPVAEVAPPPETAVATPPASPPPAALAGDATVGLSTASAATGQDEIFLSAVDAPPPAFDALALPAPVAAPDAAPGTTAPPPPFGTVYQFDEQGRILAGPTGVVAPGGFWLIAARPVRIPPPRPVTALASAPEPAAPVTDPALPPGPVTETAPESGAFAPDATVIARRPPLRPAGLTPPPADVAPETADPLQADDDASLARDDPRYAAMRPRARTAAVLARAAELAATQQAADEAQVLASASLVAAPAAQGSAAANPLAVSLSRRPAARPRDFSRAVAAAAAEASQPQRNVEPEPDPQEQAASPEAEPEPEVVATAAPRIPTRANVAKQATFANAINLSKVNLIGIYGTPSSRYAMVRTSAGRFTRVKVGDRVDGGTVAAITASEVRYKKGGRMLTLAMPRG